MHCVGSWQGNRRFMGSLEVICYIQIQTKKKPYLETNYAMLLSNLTADEHTCYYVDVEVFPVSL